MKEPFLLRQGLLRRSAVFSDKAAAGFHEAVRRDLLGRDGRERLGRERLLGGEGRRDGRLLRDGREGLLLCGGLSAAQASLMEKSTGEVYTTPAAARAARTRRRCLLNLSWRESEFGLFIAVSHG